MWVNGKIKKRDGKEKKYIDNTMSSATEVLDPQEWSEM